MAMVRLFCLYAILIFAKRAPKLITDLLNIKSENIGLKGLNIKNKLGEAALVGDKVKKGMMAAEGGIKGGIKKAAGASREILKKAVFDTNPTGVAGKIGNSIKNGWKDGKGLGKLTGAIGGAKNSIWGEKGKKANSLRENWKSFRGNLKGTLVTDAKDNAKKVTGNLAQGANEYRKKDSTKGAYNAGRKNVNINFSTLGSKFEDFADNSTKTISEWAGLDNDKAAKNRYDRSVLGLNAVGEDGGKKVKIDDEFFSKFDGLKKSNFDGKFTLDGIADISAAKAEFSKLGANSANFETYFKNMIEQNSDGSYSYKEDGVRAFKESADYKNLSEDIKAKFDADGLGGLIDGLKNIEGTFSYRLDAEALDKFRSDGEYKDWGREKQLIFDNYTNSQARDDLTTMKACFEQMGQLTSALTAANNANAATGASPSDTNYIDTSELNKQLKKLNARVREIAEQGYEYNGKKVDITNIDSALQKISEDVSKNASDLSELKASKNPKDDKK